MIYTSHIDDTDENGRKFMRLIKQKEKKSHGRRE